jgi:cellobiose transport system substrate-binding protein
MDASHSYRGDTRAPVLSTGISRRSLLRNSALVTLGVGVLPLSACSTDAGSGSGSGSTDSTLWYWGGGLSDKVVSAAIQQFKPQTTLKPSVIGGDFKQKLQTSLAGGSFLPTVTGIKGEDMPYFLSVASKFVDLNSLGAADVAAKGLEWKWKQGQDLSGKQIGYPIDIGPTAMFYRMDLFAKAGLPTDPAAVGEAVKTWDSFYELGKELHAKVPSTFPVSSLGSVWTIVLGQTTERFVSKDNAFTGDSDELHQAWLTACRAQQLGVNANTGVSFNAAVAQGKVGAEFGAAWHATDISDPAPKTSGKWRVANNPVRPTNFGGSFLTIPSATKDKKLAYEIIQWLLSAANQAQAFTDAAIFPADPAAWTSSALTGGSAFFGGQKTIEIFGPAAKLVPSQYVGPSDAAVGTPYSDELSKVESAGKDPETAWKDAVAAAREVAKRQGVSV